MFRLVLLLLFSIIGELVNSSSILVKDGVYSRVTVQIQDQPQPSSCVDFLDHLEVRKKVYFFTSVIPSLSRHWRLLCPNQEFRREGWTETSIILCKLNKSL